MPAQKKEHPKEKSALHPRNRHRGRYDFKKLIGSFPALRTFIKLNEYGEESIDFFNPVAVMHLNKALLHHFYKIEFWEVPENYLCPPIPGRADYIHYVADLLASEKQGTLPRGNLINVLDIGIGANCIYPIIGTTEYGWSFVGADIDPISIASANKIVAMNPILHGHIACRKQSNPKHFLQGIIKEREYFDLTICNPPFHASAAEAQAATLRKLSNLKGKKVTKPILNFGGKSHELWCAGGEARFVADLIRESKRFSNSCLWFTILISKQSNLRAALQEIENAGASAMHILPMSQGSKSSRIVAWTFLNSEQRKNWVQLRWK